MQKLLVITGPTATGKTSLSVALAKRFNGEIICADSRTIYKGMDIGTAKVTESEKQDIPHYGIDLVDPSQKYSVGDFKEFAEEKIRELYKKGKLPILVGGTGLYISAVLENYQFEGENGEPQYDSLVLIPEMEREEIYRRINQRVDLMVKDGLFHEVEELLKSYAVDAPGMTGIGYKEIVPAILGEVSQEEAIERLKRDSRRYAKRQITWWRHHGDVITVTGTEDAESRVEKWLK